MRKLDFLMLGLLKRLSASGRAFLNGWPAPSLDLRKDFCPLVEGCEAFGAFEGVDVLFLIRNAVSLLEFVSSYYLPCTDSGFSICISKMPLKPANQRI